MNRSWLLLIPLAALLSISSPLMADHGHGKGRGHGEDSQGSYFDRHDRDDDDDRREHRDHDDDRWERRNDRYEYRVYEIRGGRPPGWSRGRKVGWGECGMPPGQAKKYGCRTYVYEERTYYYYEDDSGHIFVRRPSIHVDFGGVVIH
jgi:hypothetical protein